MPSNYWGIFMRLLINTGLGAAGGAIAGAVVGGPIGAGIGAGIGAAMGATSGLVVEISKKIFNRNTFLGECAATATSFFAGVGITMGLSKLMAAPLAFKAACLFAGVTTAASTGLGLVAFAIASIAGAAIMFKAR